MAIVRYDRIYYETQGHPSTASKTVNDWLRLQAQSDVLRRVWRRIRREGSGVPDRYEESSSKTMNHGLWWGWRFQKYFGRRHCTAHQNKDVGEEIWVEDVQKLWFKKILRRPNDGIEWLTVGVKVSSSNRASTMKFRNLTSFSFWTFDRNFPHAVT